MCSSRICAYYPTGDNVSELPLVTCVQEESGRNGRCVLHGASACERVCLVIVCIPISDILYYLINLIIYRLTEKMVSTSFSNATSELILAPKNLLSITELKMKEIKKLLTDDTSLPLHWRTSSNSSCSSAVLLDVHCCHVCAGKLSGQRPLSEIDQYPPAHGQHTSIALGSACTVTNSDWVQQLSCGCWQNMEENYRLQFHEHDNQTEVDHGVSPSNQPLMDQIVPFHQILDHQTSDPLEVEDLQYSVQEVSSSCLSKQKEEIVFGKEPLLLQREENHERPYYNMKHVFSGPFVCNMPPFMGEQYT